MKKEYNRWENDVTIICSRVARAKLKLKAALQAKTLKALLEEFANEK